MIFFLALKYCPSDIQTNANYNVSSRYWNSYFSVSRSLVFPSWCLPKAWNLAKSIDESNVWLLLRITILILQKFQNMLILSIYLGMQSHRWPQLQASCVPPRLESKGFRLFRFWGVSVLKTISSVPCNCFLIVLKSPEVFFNMESSRLSKPDLPLITNLMCSFKVSIYCFLLEIEKLIKKSLTC